MAKFQSAQVGRFSVHVLPTKQFRTRHINVKLSQPITRADVTRAAMLPYLWMEGTTSYPSSRALMQRADELFGAIVRTSIGKRGNRHILETYASVPEEAGLEEAAGLFKQSQSLALDLLLDPVLEHEQFPEGHVDRERALHQKRIESIFDDKVAFAMERCTKEVCRGDDAGLPRFGYIEDLVNANGKSLYETHQRLLESADIHVYVVGDVGDVKAVQEQLLNMLSNRLTERTSAIQGTISPLLVENRSVQTVIDNQDVLQGKLNLGFRTGISYAHELYPAFLVMNGILGGFPHSKLFVNVREKHSLAYYASSRLDSMTGIMAIQTGIEIDKYDQALEIILAQVDAIRQGQIVEEELTFTKRGLKNQYLQLLDQPMTLADIHFNGVLSGVHREVDELLASIDTVTVDSVVDAAKHAQLDTIYFLRNEEVTTHA